MNRVMHRLDEDALAAVMDPARVAALAPMAGAGPDAELDDLARAAARTCRTPVGLITVLDAERQWNVGRHGTNLDVLPVGLSLCAHVVAGGTTVVPDLRLDERFATHPLVATAGGLRFYAGVPLRVAGVVAGALAVADVRPRSLSSPARNRLTTLAVTAAAALQARLAAAVAQG